MAASTLAAGSGPSKVLFVTNSEHGQANVVLAVAHDLLLRGDVAVHVASFGELEPRIHEANAIAKRAAPNASKLHFHVFGSPSMREVVVPDGTSDDVVRGLLHDPGFFNLWKAYGRIPDIFLCWKGSHYLSQVKDIERFSQQIKPDMIIVDSGFMSGVDGAIASGEDWMFISPNSFKDIVLPFQPKGEALWKIPSFGIGWDFPLRWWQIPLNIILQVRLVVLMLFTKKARDLSKARKQAGLKGPFPMFARHNVPYVLPCTPEMDYPVFVPDNIHGCGPFLLPSEPVKVLQPELATWLERGPSVLINRGSHLRFSDETARKMAEGIRILRQKRPDVRVLWKLKPEKDMTEKTLELLQDDIHADMVRVVPWLKPDPLAILRIGKVICFANHGGANSWFEGASTGVPMVILPGWYDCWDWAVRTDYLNVGVWGNRKGGNSLDGEELGEAFLRACEEPAEGATTETQASSKNSNLRLNAQRLAAKAGSPGTKKAADFILDHAKACREKRSTPSSRDKAGVVTQVLKETPSS